MVIDGNLPASIAQAVQALRAGQLVGLPTETVYGLAADASSSQAVAAIFAAKGRPADHPLIVHVAGAEAVAHFAANVPAFAQKLMAAFWPGPLTVILARRPGVADAAAGGQDSVGLRCPAHPVAQAVLQALAATGKLVGDVGEVADSTSTSSASTANTDANTPPIYGLAAPSANLFGRISPTTAAHVQAELGNGLLVLDGGACAVGIESTIVDCSRGAPVLLRPGAVSRAQIEAACGQRLLAKEELPAQVPRVPGSLDAHYAPHAKLRLMPAKALQTALDVLGADAAHIAVYCRSALRTASSRIVMRRMPDDAAAAAQQLFAVLRSFDDQKVKLIWVEIPPYTPDWDGVNDRLTRAAAS